MCVCAQEAGGVIEWHLKHCDERSLHLCCGSSDFMSPSASDSPNMCEETPLPPKTPKCDGVCVWRACGIPPSTAKVTKCRLSIDDGRKNENMASSMDKNVYLIWESGVCVWKGLRGGGELVPFIGTHHCRTVEVVRPRGTH